MTSRTLHLWPCPVTSDLPPVKPGGDGPDLAPVARAVLAHSEYIEQLIVLSDGDPRDADSLKGFLAALLHRNHRAMLDFVLVPLRPRLKNRSTNGLVSLHSDMRNALAKYPPAADVQRGVLVSGGYTLQGGLFMHFALSQTFPAKLFEVDDQEGKLVELTQPPALNLPAPNTSPAGTEGACAAEDTPLA